MLREVQYLTPGRPTLLRLIALQGNMLKEAALNNRMRILSRLMKQPGAKVEQLFLLKGRTLIMSCLPDSASREFISSQDSTLDHQTKQPIT